MSCRSNLHDSATALGRESSGRKVTAYVPPSLVQWSRRAPCRIFSCGSALIMLFRAIVARPSWTWARVAHGRDARATQRFRSTAILAVASGCSHPLLHRGWQASPLSGGLTTFIFVTRPNRVRLSCGSRLRPSKAAPATGLRARGAQRSSFKRCGISFRWRNTAGSEDGRCATLRSS